MNFQLNYSGPPKHIAAKLLVDGRPLSETTGLRNKRAARRWARNEAATYKLNSIDDPWSNHTETKFISGTQGFSL